MAIDDEAFGRREPKFKVIEIAERITLKNPWEFFDYTNKNDSDRVEEIEALQFPLDRSRYAKLSVRWKRGLELEKKQILLAQTLKGLSYKEKVDVCRRPEKLSLFCHFKV